MIDLKEFIQKLKKEFEYLRSIENPSENEFFRE